MSRNNSNLTTERYAYIETELLWGGGLSAGKLARTFGISRQAAQGLIDRYRKDHPEQIKYDASLKRHLPKDSFRALFIRENAIAFLDYLRGQALVGMYREDQDWSEHVMTDVDRLLRPDLKVETMRTVLSALRSQTTVMIDYKSKSLEPDSISIRVISPNHLIFADDRYHLRAFCHKKSRYLDFVLSRIAHAEGGNQEWVDSTEDREWNEFTELCLKPNPDLASSVQNAILMGYDTVESGARIVKCRRALLFYVKRKLLAKDPKYNLPLWCVCWEKSVKPGWSQII